MSRVNPADFFDDARDADDEDEAGEELFFCGLCRGGGNSLEGLRVCVADDAVPCEVVGEGTEVEEEPLFMAVWDENSFGSLNECCGTGRTVFGVFLNRRGIVA